MMVTGSSAMTPEEIERVRRELGADKVIKLAAGQANGPLDLLQQRAEVAELRMNTAPEPSVQYRLRLAAPPLVMHAASLVMEDPHAVSRVPETPGSQC
jgi:hypothetical protein